MIQDQITWGTLFRGVVPLCSASIFLVVLVYFYLARFRIGRAFSFYALFICCFIFFLCGPLINMLPIGNGKYWLDIGRNILLFSVGLPCLLLALIYQAEINVNRMVRFFPFVVGVMWSCLFIMAPPLFYFDSTQIPWLFNIESIRPRHVYYAQVFVIALLVLSCVFILKRTKSNTVVVNIYGTLTLCFFMCIGNIFQYWELYYAGASLTAFIWGTQVYKEIQITHQQVKIYAENQASLARAQFLAPTNTEFTPYLTKKLNENYPFDVQASLLKAISTSNLSVVEQKTIELVNALKVFTQHNFDNYKIQVKDVVFILFDSVMYKQQENLVKLNTQALLLLLEKRGVEVERSNTLEELDSILQSVVKYLTELVLEQQLTKVSAGDEALVERVKKYLLENYDHNITINDVTHEIGASRAHVMKIFKQVTSTTINQYLIEIRVAKAKTLLLSQSISKTAYDVGFSTPAYFSTVFKKITNTTPKQYQADAKLRL